MKTTKKLPSLYFFLSIIIIFLLLMVGYLSHSLIQLSDYQNLASNQSETRFLTESPPENSLTKQSEKITTFTHPTIKYSINFPYDWKPQLFISPAGRSIQPYRDIILYSPGYDPKATNDSSLSQQKNASILIRVAETPYEDIESKFNDNLAAQKIARNITRISLSNTPAIQYDYSFKNENATAVTMVKDGRWYFIKFQYDNEEIKRKYIDAFQEVIKSLKL